MTVEKKRKHPHKIVFVRGAGDLYRWTRVARNGRIMGASARGFENKRAAIDNAKLENKGSYYRCEIVDKMPGRMPSISRPPRIVD